MFINPRLFDKLFSALAVLLAEVIGFSYFEAEHNVLDNAWGNCEEIPHLFEPVDVMKSALDSRVCCIVHVAEDHVKREVVHFPWEVDITKAMIPAVNSRLLSVKRIGRIKMTTVIGDCGRAATMANIGAVGTVSILGFTICC
jgi:hypothetical protein